MCQKFKEPHNTIVLATRGGLLASRLASSPTILIKHLFLATAPALKKFELDCGTQSKLIYKFNAHPISYQIS